MILQPQPSVLGLQGLQAITQQDCLFGVTHAKKANCSSIGRLIGHFLGFASLAEFPENVSRNSKAIRVEAGSDFRTLGGAPYRSPDDLVSVEVGILAAVEPEEGA